MSNFQKITNGVARGAQVQGTDIGSGAATSIQFLAANGSGGSAFRNISPSDISGFATTALDNLSAVAINISLLPGTTGINLGNVVFPFDNLYLQQTASGPHGTIYQNGQTLIHTFGDSVTHTNFFAGYEAGNLTMSDHTNKDNTGIGAFALNSIAGATNSGKDNTAVGTNSLTLTTTGLQNTAVGSKSMSSNISGGRNTALGYQSLLNLSTGSFNTAVGYNCLPANTTGQVNVAIGRDVATSHVTGDDNTFVGAQSAGDHNGGQYNSSLGFASGGGVVAGVGNTGLGTFASASGDWNNSTSVGFCAFAGATNAMVLGGINGLNNATANTNVGIGTTTPNVSALLTLDPTVSGFVQQVLVPGTLVGSPISGAIENDGTNLYYTDSSPTRQTLLTTASGANTALSNLASTAVNVDLSPGGTTDTLNFGSATNVWHNGFIHSLLDQTSTLSVNTLNRTLNADDASISLAYNTRNLITTGNVSSLDWQNSLLLGATGVHALAWSDNSVTIKNLIISPSNTAQGITINGSTSGDVFLRASSTTTTYNLVLPSDQGGVSTVLTNDGSGGLSWGSASAGTVTSISVNTANGLAGSSSGGATPSLTLSTTITGILQGNGTAISAATTTGSGSVVLATAPTLSNPVVGTQSQGDNSTKGASTAYVDVAIANAVAGVNPAVAVQAATTSAGDTSALTYNNGVSGVGATLTGANNTALTVDGFTFTTVGQRLLVKNDTQSPSGAFNGVYYVTQVQAALLPLVLTRALDYDMPSDINNTGAIPVINGTVNGTTQWVLTSLVTNVGVDPLTFTVFSKNPASYVSSTLTQNHILVGNASNVATDVAMSGDISIVASGATTVAKIAGTIVSGTTGTTNVVFSAAPTLTGLLSGGSASFSSTIAASNFSGSSSGTNTGDQTITLTGDVTGSGTGSFATTLATVNSNVGSFGSSTSIPSFTVNAKGLITAASGNAVVAPAGTLSGTTLNSTVVSSSLTSVGTITSGTWNGTTIAVANGGTGLTSGTSGGILGYTASGTLASSAALTANQLIIGGGAGATPSTLSAGSQYQVLTMGASNPGYGAVNLAQSAAITGVLPSANVGLGRTINAQTGTTYTFALADGSAAGGNPLVTASNASAQTYTVPTNASVAFPVGTQIDLMQQGAGKVTLAGAGGVTINSKGANLSISAQYVGVSLIKTATDVWTLFGDLIA